MICSQQLLREDGTKMPKTEVVRVLRIIEYTGPREWIERTIAESIHGQYDCGHSCIIRTATIGTYPEILEETGDD